MVIRSCWWSRGEGDGSNGDFVGDGGGSSGSSDGDGSACRR